MATIAKRKRGSNYTVYEKKALLEILNRHISIIENKATNGLVLKEKQKAWVAIAEEFNAIATSGPRTWAQLRHLYENLKQRTKNGPTKNREETSSTDSELPKRIKIVPRLEVPPPISNRVGSSHRQLNNIMNGISRIEHVTSQIPEKEDEFDLFGRSIVLQMRKLPEHAGLQLMQKIQGMVTDMRLLYSQNYVPDMKSEQEDYDTENDSLLIH